MNFLSNLRLTPKFLLLGGIAFLMLLLPVTLYFQVLFHDMGNARQERAASPAVLALNAMVSAVQQHRGLSAGALAGNADMARRLPAVREQVLAQMGRADQVMATLGLSDTLHGQWRQVREGWAEIERMGTGAQVDAERNFLAHTALVRHALVANNQLLGESGFSSEPDRALNALIQTALVTAPQLGEHLGIMRAQGVGHLARQHIDGTGRANLRNGLHRAGQLKEDLELGLQRAFHANAGMGPVLAQPAASALDEVAAVLGLVDSALLQAAQPSHAPEAYFNTLTQAIDHLGRFNTLAVSQIDEALGQRVSQDQRWLAGLVALLVLGLLVAYGLAFLIVRSITRPVDQALQVAAAVSQGDLTVAIPVQGSNEFSRLMAEMEHMRQNLMQLVVQMNESAGHVAIASRELSHNSQSLSDRSISQASALEETATSMEEITATVRNNADHAQQANERSAAAASVATRSGEAVAQVATTMGALNDSARQIVEIVDVIDGIAFQTNILALNASVEAARAGVQGRGFAVVATEVRALAQRSASAAREIKVLIDSSVQAIGQGHRQAAEAGETMQETVTGIRHVTEIMQEITAASREQSIGIGQVNDAVTQMDQVTQQNVSLVEEVAAAAENLQTQADGLAQLVARFRVDSTTAPGARALHAELRHYPAPRQLAVEAG